MTEKDNMTSITPLSEYKESTLFDSVKSLIATAIPQSAVALGLAYFSSMNLALQVLVAAVAAHLASSLAVVLTVPDGKGVREFFRDALSRAIAIAAVGYLGTIPGLEFNVFGKSLSGGALVGFFIIVSEVIEFEHDMEKMGMRVFPKFLMTLIENAKDQLNSGESVTMLTSFFKSKKDGVETVTKSTTVVTTKPPEAPSV